MAERPGVPVRMRQVSAALREHRIRAGLTADEVARSLGMSPSKLCRLERGQRSPQPDDVSALLGLYRVQAERREQLLALVHTCHDHNWWQPRDGQLPALWEQLIRLEQAATEIRNYETMFVPGLLQTAEYAAALLRGTTPEIEDQEIQALVKARMSRQTILRDRAVPLLELFVEQGALERPVGGPDVMGGQLWHLMGSARRENVCLRVMPSTVGAHPGLDGPLMLLEFEQHSSVVYLEHRGNSAFLEGAEHLAEARKALRWLRKFALSQDDSVELIARLEGEWADDEQGARRGDREPVLRLMAQEQSQ